MSAFVLNLEATLRGRLAELDDERGRIEAALSHLAPKPDVRVHKQHVPRGVNRIPRGVNRRLILGALKSGSRSAAQLREETGIARNTLDSTLTAMKNAGVVSRTLDGRWKRARR